MARGPLGVTRAGRSPVIARPGPGTLDFAFRSIRGGKHRVMELATLAIEFEPRLEPIVTAWSQMTSWQRRTTSLEQLIAPTSLKPGEFLAATVRAAFELSNELTDLLVAAAFPGVVQTCVR